MKIQVGGLSEGLHTYRFTAPPSELGLPQEFDETVAVDATLEKAGGSLFLTARLSTTAEWECDRCVAPFRSPFASSYTMYYVWESEAAARFDPAEVQVIPAGLNMIDIADDVRQTIELSVPLKRVCREDCRGLCPHCGRNLNEGTCQCTSTAVDGRWDKLKELQTNTKHDVR